MTELSAILCHAVPPIKGSSIYSLPAVHTLDLNHTISIIPLIYFCENLPASDRFLTQSLENAAILIANSYVRSQTFLDKNKKISVYNLDPTSVKFQPLKQHLVDENYMFSLTPEHVEVNDPTEPVTDYNAEYIHHLAKRTAEYFDYFKKEDNLT